MRMLSLFILLVLTQCSLSFFLEKPSNGARLFNGIRGVQDGVSLHGTTTPATAAADEPNAVAISSSNQQEEDQFNAIMMDQSIELLNDALLDFNSTSAAMILSDIAELRQDENNQASVNAYLDNLLAKGPDGNMPLWAELRPLSRFSRRARMACLKRTLSRTTPPPSVQDEQEDQEDSEDKQRRRRRALVSILRTLASPAESASTKHPAIRFLEQQAKTAASPPRRRPQQDEMTLRRPSDLETPKYTVLTTGPNGYQVRSYQPFAVCSVSVNQPRPPDASTRTDASVANPKSSSSRAFGALAGYLFGKNQQQKSMAMTTPVIMNQDKMSFVLPSEYWTNESGDATTAPPEPLVNSGVVLEQVTGGERAVIMFGGYASKNEVQRRKKQLQDAVRKDKKWMVIDGEPITLAQYNDPFTPPWKRLNEVSVPVQSRSYGES